ncbi:MAG: ABC transporter permease [Anaerolineales bacterium]
MSLRRTGVLLWKELTKGSRSFIFIMALVVPVLISLLLALLFGTVFSDRATLGIVDEGSSQIPARAAEMEALNVREYESANELRDAVARGSVDIGMVLPEGFDDQVAAREPTEVAGYIWGESGLDSRAILGTSILSLFRDVAGYEPPVEIVTTTLGESQTLPWEDRLLPLIVLLTIMLGGMMVPATSMTQERQDRTLSALTITPATLGEVLTSKGIVGVLVASTMAIVTLTINDAFGGNAVLLIVALILASIMAVSFGLLLGVMTKDINSLFGTIKAMGLILYAPALVFMFPEIPQWIAQLFPTYYIIRPIIEITQMGAGLIDVLPELFVLILLIAALLAITAYAARRKAEAAA